MSNLLFNQNKIDLDELNLNEIKSLDEIFITFGTDKGSLDSKKTYDHLKQLKKSTFEFKNYEDWIKRKNLYEFEHQAGLDFADYYDGLFKNLKNEKIKILEIGVANGHSIASWHHYFKNAIIYGIDKKSNYKFFYKSKRINYFSLSITDLKNIEEFNKTHGKFDIIIDDSIHDHWAMYLNIKNFYKALNFGGTYIVEDFRIADNLKKEEMIFNENNKTKYLLDNFTTIEKFVELLNLKKFSKNDILDEATQNYLYKTTESAKIFYTKHPWGSLAVFKKKMG